MPFIKSWGRFAGWWAGIASFYAASGGSCPCCGAPGCPVGAAGAGFFGLLCAAVIRHFQSKIKPPASITHEAEWNGIEAETSGQPQ